MAKKLTAMGWVRLVLYVVSGLIGLGAFVAATLGYGDVAHVLGTLASAGAAVTGGTAAANLGKAPDQNSKDQSSGGSLVVGEIATALAPIVTALPSIAAAANTWNAQANYVPRHAAVGEDTGEPADVVEQVVEEGTYPGLGG
ncbi:hypothetical protein [Corynebacterium macclintockiae]|uniref:hypothetical protein n=1 Tax=Corynebacterium macclintockiae TaxID=2913501 RepID=UPI003EBD80BC